MLVELVDVENPFLYNGDSPKGRGLGESQSKRENFIDSCPDALMEMGKVIKPKEYERE
jgi:hypothetical protein